jgi:hypothetical protein
MYLFNDGSQTSDVETAANALHLGCETCDEVEASTEELFALIDALDYEDYEVVKGRGFRVWGETKGVGWDVSLISIDV